MNKEQYLEKLFLYFQIIYFAIKGLVFKQKFKAYFLFLTDPEHRSKVMFIRRNMQNKKAIRIIRIPIYLINPSHKIIYHDWVCKLAIRIWHYSLITKPIDVFEFCNQYYVADGHHRLEANRIIYGKNHQLRVRIFK